MLVLSRREKESLVIGDNIFITVKKIHSDRVQFIIEGAEGLEVIKEKADRRDVDKSE